MKVKIILTGASPIVLSTRIRPLPKEAEEFLLKHAQHLLWPNLHVKGTEIVPDDTPAIGVGCIYGAPDNRKRTPEQKKDARRKLDAVRFLANCSEEQLPRKLDALEDRIAVNSFAQTFSALRDEGYPDAEAAALALKTCVEIYPYTIPEPCPYCKDGMCEASLEDIQCEGSFDDQWNCLFRSEVYDLCPVPKAKTYRQPQKAVCAHCKGCVCDKPEHEDGNQAPCDGTVPDCPNFSMPRQNGVNQNGEQKAKCRFWRGDVCENPECEDIEGEPPHCDGSWQNDCFEAPDRAPVKVKRKRPGVRYVWIVTHSATNAPNPHTTTHVRASRLSALRKLVAVMKTLKNSRYDAEDWDLEFGELIDPPVEHLMHTPAYLGKDQLSWLCKRASDGSTVLVTYERREVLP